jgi:hypothetical protein
LREQAVVLRVRANPEPDYLLAFLKPHRAIASPYSNRIYRTIGMNRLEVQAWMIGILLEKAIGSPSLALNIG